MSEPALLWVLGALVAVITALAGALWVHIMDDRTRDAERASSLARMVTLERELQALRDWKHSFCEPAVRYVGYLKEEKPWER
jgi:predicted outer membrane lipoprotein